MELINKTGVPNKYSGDGLSHIELNSINSSTNKCIDGTNYLLKSFCNINVECNDFTRIFTLEQAINQVPVSRRSPGLRIRFLNEKKNYVEYTYSSNSIQEEDWINVSNWYNNSPEERNIIDGGEWE